MNIQEAKDEICNTVRAYLRKDAAGNYRYPPVRQRPLLLMGPPGIGKTAILEQAAAECGVGLVSYALTHHTRQSAIGLPHIEKRVYCGQELDVTEYTMSEIVASIYACMERTGAREGLLFLDEINCVSETLAPTMLQLLQNKTFGSHRVPEGWVIVAAGNPPEYNRAVREFDVVTLDRVRQIDVGPDCETWMAYAWAHGVHGAVLSYLSLKPEHFYLVEEGEERMAFVTARGWEDLSELLKGYEALDIPVGAAVVGEFLHKDEIARAFAAYYQLYRRYGTDYAVPELLSGELAGAAYAAKAELAKQGGFEERLTLVQLILDRLHSGFARFERLDRRVCALHGALGQLRDFWRTGGGTLAAFWQRRQDSLQVKVKAGLCPPPEQEVEEAVIVALQGYELLLKEEHIREAEGFERIEQAFQVEVAQRNALAEELLGWISRAFRFVLECFGDGQELLLLVSGLTRSPRAAAFLSEFPCDAYLEQSGKLLFRQREKVLQQRCDELLRDPGSNESTEAGTASKAF